MALQPTWVKADLSQAIEELRKARAKLQDELTPTPEELEKQKKIKELEALNAAAEKAKAELLAADKSITTTTSTTARTTSSAMEDEGTETSTTADGSLHVTHTATALEMTTHVEWVVQTVTAAPGSEN